MAETEIRCVFVETNLETHIGVIVDNHHQTISEFKEKLCIEHQQCFPELGEINISAVKVKRRNRFYHLSDRMILCKPFEGINISWYMYVDATARVDKREVLSIMDADQNGSNHELVEKKKEIAKDHVLLDGYTKNLTVEEAFETEVAEKTTKKRKLKCSDGEKSRKKPSVDLDQSAAAKTALRVDVDESHELCGKVMVDIVASETCAVFSPREKLDDILMGAIGKENEMVEKSVEDVGRDKMETDNDASHPANHLDTNSVLTTSPDTEKKKDADQSCINHEVLEKKKEIANDSVLLDGHTKNLTIEEGFETEVAKKTTKKRKLKSLDGKKRQKKPSSDLNQSAAATTASRFDVDESHELGGKVEVGVVASESSPTEKLDDILTGGVGKENEMGEKSVDDVGRNKIEADNITSHPANHLDVTNPEKEKKKRRKKSSKDDFNQSSATTSRDIVNEINGVPGNVDRVDATSDSLPISTGETLGNPFAEAKQKENEVVEKFVQDVRRDDIESDNLASHPAKHLDANSGLTIRTDTEKKKRRKKSSKDDISQSSVVPTTTSGDIVNEINGVPGNVDRVDAISESLPVSRRGALGNPIAEATQNETEMGEKINDDVGSGEAIPSAADNIQTNNVEVDADETKSVKSTKKKKSRKAKTLSKEDTVVASGENVEPIKVVDGEEPDNVIRNVLDSLQERNETEENLEKIEKKSSKRSMKKQSLKVVESEVLSVEVNNAALEENPPINNPKDTDALFTPAKKDAESDALHLKKSTEAADQVRADMGDNFGSSLKDDIVGGGKKQDQVTVGVKSKKEKKRLGLHPSGSIDGSLSSMKPKAKKGRVQPDTEPAKKDTESDALHVEKSTVAADDTEDNSLSKQIPKEKADIGDNFGSGQKDDIVSCVRKQDQVTGGTKSKKEKKRLDSHPGDSIDGSLSSMKPKEKKGRVQPDIEPAKKDTESDALHLEKSTEVADNAEDNSLSKQIQKEKADMGDNFGSSQKVDTVGGVKKQDQGTGGAKSKKERKGLDLHPGGSIDGSLSSMKPKEKKGRVQPASSGTSHLQSRVKNDGRGSLKVDVNSKKEEAVKKNAKSLTVDKSKTKSLTMDKSKTNFFEGAENESEDESKTSNVSTRTPSDSSSDDDSDVTSTSKLQGNNLAGGTNKFSGSLQDMLRRSSSYKKALLRASQSQADTSDDEAALDFVPDSQAV